MGTSGNDASFSAEAVPRWGDSQRDKRDRIIERAIIMFNRVGYDRVRVSDLTDSLDIGKGTFYLYFRNKKELLLACFEHVVELIHVLESLPQIREGDFFTKIRSRVELIHRYDWYPGLINLVRAAEMSPDKEIRLKARQAYDAIADPMKRDLEAAMRTGRARDVEAELAIYGFIGMGEDVWFRSRLDDRYSLEQVTDFLVDATTRFLSSGVSVEDAVRPSRETTARLVDRGGTVFDLHDVRCNGETQLTATLGQAEIDLGLARVSVLVVAEADENCVADLTMDDGTEVQVRIDGSIVLSGGTSLGTIRIAMRDVSSLTRA